MTTGEKLHTALGKAREQAGGKLTREQWIESADKCLYECRRKPSAKVPRPGRPRNPLFDTLATVCGARDLAKITRTEAKLIGCKLAEIMEVTPDLTVQEIERCAGLYRSRHPTWPLTVAALAKHWSEFARSEPTRSAKRDIYVEPPKWRELAAQMFPESLDWTNPHDFTAMAWLDVAATIREKIIQKLYFQPDQPA